MIEKTKSPFDTARGGPSARGAAYSQFSWDLARRKRKGEGKVAKD